MIPIDTEVALSFFLRLTLGHFVGDFVLQPYWLVLAKREGWRGLTIHVGVVTFTTAILVWGTLPNWWVWVIVLFIGHLFIDQFRTFVFTDNTRGKGLLLLILDQIAHMLLIILIAWAAIGWTFSSLAILFDPNAPSQYLLLAYLIGAAILLSTSPVLEAEITVAVWAAQGQEITYTVRIDTEDRVYGALERFTAVALIVFGLWMITPLVFIPRFILMVRQGQMQQDKSAVITKVATSFGSALIVGLILQAMTASATIFT